jgi:alpha-methylacyl-CoA racemase
MMLADMGAEVTRVDRLIPGALGGGGTVVDRGRKTIAIDLKNPSVTGVMLRLIDTADVLIEGNRPGVMERLGLGPDVCLARNPRLVYGRMTGWGQSGPLALAAGHDLNYIGLTGALHAMGHTDRAPPPPLHLVGDLGGGAMMLAFGVVCAVLEAHTSGKGQVIDAAICDGASLLASSYHDSLSRDKWHLNRQSNMLDGGAPFYRCYTCADGKFLSVGPIEPPFYRLFLERAGVDDPTFIEQWNRGEWPALHARLEALFLTRSRDRWCELFDGSDACVAPVLDFVEATKHPHNVARGNFIETDGVLHPAPAPRFSRTPAEAGPLAKTGEHTLEVLRQLGLNAIEIGALRASGAIA